MSIGIYRDTWGSRFAAHFHGDKGSLGLHGVYLLHPSGTRICSAMRWVVVKELELSYYNGDVLLSTRYLYYGI